MALKSKTPLETNLEKTFGYKTKSQSYQKQGLVQLSAIPLELSFRNGLYTMGVPSNIC